MDDTVGQAGREPVRGPEEAVTALVPESDQEPRDSTRKVVLAGAIGNFVEFYDFAIYAIFASQIAANFFPQEDSTTSLLATFALFAVSFVVRPLGSVVFGHFGDRYGRRGTLTITVSVMGLATLVIGVLPSYGQIGLAAPLLLLVARLVQGLSAGGEVGGSFSLVTEWAPAGRRGLYASTIQIGNYLATLCAPLLGTILASTLSAEDLQSWGWRIPFLIGGILGGVGLYLRMTLRDTPEFKAASRENKLTASPVRTSFRLHFRMIVIMVGVIAGAVLCNYGVFSYGPTYLQRTVGMTPQASFLSTTISLCVVLVLIPVFAILSDRVGRRPVMIAFGVALVAFAYPLFLVMSTGHFVAVVLAQCGFGVIIALWAGPGTAMVSEAFPTNVRYSGAGMSYSIGTILGGVTPFVITLLISTTGNPLAPAFWLMAGGAATLLATLAIAETARSPLRKA